MRNGILELLLAKWLWIIILGGIAAILSGLVFFYVILMVPPPWRGLAMISVSVAWGVAAGYKDWRLYRSREQRMKWHAGKEESARSV